MLKLMGLSSADRHRNSTRDDPKKQHVEMFIQNSDNAFVQNLVAAGYTPTDMRRLNGQSEDAAFTDFIDVVHEMLPKRDQLAGEERRDGAPSSGAPAGKAAAIRPSSLAPSMRALHSQGEKNDVCRHRNPRPIRRWDQQDSSLVYLCYVHVPFAPPTESYLTASPAGQVSFSKFRVALPDRRTLMRTTTTCKLSSCVTGCAGLRNEGSSYVPSPTMISARFLWDPLVCPRLQCRANAESSRDRMRSFKQQIMTSTAAASPLL